MSAKRVVSSVVVIIGTLILTLKAQGPCLCKLKPIGKNETYRVYECNDPNASVADQSLDQSKYIFSSVNLNVSRHGGTMLRLNRCIIDADKLPEASTDQFFYFIMLNTPMSRTDLSLIRAFSNLIELHLVNANVTTINILDNMRSLERVDLSSNLIESLDESSSLSLRLQSLNLNSNRIKHISRDFFLPFKHLKALALKHNQLMQLDVRFELNYHNWSTIDVSNNDLSQLVRVDVNSSQRITVNFNLRSTNLRQPANLTVSNGHYIIYENKFNSFILYTSLSDKIYFRRTANVTDWPLDQRYFLPFNFNHFVMSECQLTRLPRLDQLNRMRTLDMSFNWLKHLHRSENYLPPSVESLNLSDNRLEYIQYDFFSRFLNLKELNLRRNRLNILDTLEFTSSWMVSLDLSFNSLKILKHLKFKSTDRIDTIKLNNNRLRLMPSLCGRVSHVGTFDMSNQAHSRLRVSRLFIEYMRRVHEDAANFTRIDRLNLSNSSLDWSLFNCLIDMMSVQLVEVDLTLNSMRRQQSLADDADFLCNLNFKRQLSENMSLSVRLDECDQLKKKGFSFANELVRVDNCDLDFDEEFCVRQKVDTVPVLDQCEAIKYATDLSGEMLRAEDALSSDNRLADDRSIDELNPEWWIRSIYYNLSYLVLCVGGFVWLVFRFRRHLIW